ncbi:MAG: hypothetical protein ACK4K1_09870 [Flavobacterium sp.]
MQKATLIIFGFLLVLACQQKNTDTNPLHHLNNQEILTLKEQTVRYFERLPAKATEQNKFDTIFNEYYSQKAKEADLFLYFKNDQGEEFFAVSKIAPSMKLKKVATIIQMKREADSIIFYKEILRTWKMEVPELQEKSKVLFDLVIQNKSFEKYLTKNFQPEFWVEFPDDHTYFDDKSRTWKTK